MATEEPESGLPRRVCDYIADSLVQQGVRCVYGGHGGSVIPLINAITNHKDLKWVYTRNEGAASLAAAAEAKLTGRLAVCVATSGPGASNLTTGLIDALQDRVPVLALTGMKTTQAIDLSEFQAIHQEQLFRAAGLAVSQVIVSESAVPAMLRNAIAVAMREQTAVHLALPVDIQARPLVLPPMHRELRLVSQMEYAASESRIRQAAEAIADPTLRIVVALGHHAAIGITSDHAGSQHNPFVRLAETLNAPMITQLDAKGVVDESHALAYGVIGIFGQPGLDSARALVRAADVILLFGVNRQAVDLISDANFNQVRRVVEFEPDAGSAAYHRWYDCEAVVLGDLMANARRLEAAVANLRDTPAARSAASLLGDVRPINEDGTHWSWLLTGGWRQDVMLDDDAENHRPARFRVEHEKREGFCHPAELLTALAPQLEPCDVLAIDVGDVTLWSSLCLCLSGGQRVLSSQCMGTMGYSLPAAIAASLARPERRVVAIAGDGGAQMTIGELATAKQHGCTITYIIFNNNLLGRVHFGFEGVSGDVIDSPDFVALGRAYGFDGMHVRSADDVPAALKAAANHTRGVYIIEVRTDPELKAEYARMRDTGAFLVQLRTQLGDVLPSDLRPSDIRKLIAFDVDGDGILSAEELHAARKVLQNLRATVDPPTFLKVLRTGQLFKNPVLTCVKQLLQPLDPSPFVFSAGGGSGSQLHVVGSVEMVLESYVPDHLRTAKWAAGAYKAGFETGAVDAIEGLGEMCICDGTAYIRETQEGRPDFYETRVAESFLTTAAILLPKEAVPDWNVLMEARLTPKGVPFVRTINDLYAKVQAPFVFCGEVEWHKCDVTSLSRAPVDGLSIPAHIHQYYWEPGAVLHNVRTFVCGTAARDESPRSEMGEQIFSRIFYADLSKHHAESSTRISEAVGQHQQLHCHAHLITYHGNKLADVWHLQPDSVVRACNLQLYSIGSLKVLDI